MKSKRMTVHNSRVHLMRGDCIEGMDSIEAASIDCILCDPPYGTTDAPWDTLIPLDAMWEQLWRVLKPNGAILLFAGQPFTSQLIMSQVNHYRYNWYWNKRKAANFLFMNNMPGKLFEDVCVFYKAQPTYNPQKILNTKREMRHTYKPTTNSERSHLLMKSMPVKSGLAGKKYEADKLLPNNILEFSKPAVPVHPTQKPVELLKYLIRTYTNKGETVLDFTMGSGSTGVACAMLSRNFVGIEKKYRYYKVAKRRIQNLEGDGDTAEPQNNANMAKIFTAPR
jgi:site-specific DNA-methyltransferase (adenine-specific)